MKKLVVFWKGIKNKKQLTIIAAAFVVVVLLVLLFVMKPFSASKQIDPLTMIPDNAAVIFKVNKTNLFTNDSTSYPLQLKAFSLYRNFVENINLADSILNILPSGKDLIKNNTLYVSLHLSAKNSSLYIIDIKNNTVFENIENELLENKKINIEERIFEKQKYFSINKGEFFVCNYNNLFIGSADEKLLQSSILCKKTPNKFYKNENFTKTTQIASQNADVNIYIYFPFLYKAIEKTFTEETYANLLFLQHFSEWGNIDISNNETGLLISGALLNSSTNSFINIFTETADPNIICNYIPANAAACQSFAFNNFASGFSEYIKYHNASGSDFNIEEEQKLFDKNAGANSLSNEIVSCLGKTMTLFLCENSSTTNYDEFCMLPINNSNDFANKIRNIMKSSSKSDDWDSLTYRDVPIFMIPANYGAYSLFGPLFKSMEETILAVSDSVIYVCSNISAMKNMLNNVLSGRTLAATSSYHQLQNGLNPLWHTFSYLNIANASSLLSNKWLADTILLTNIQELANEMRLAVTCSREKQGIIISGSICFDNAEEQNSNSWTTTLDANIENGPYILYSKKQDKFWILASDNYENVYLLNQNGKVEWKQKVDGIPNNDYALINDNIPEKTSVIFSTENSLYKINIDGKINKTFPINITKGISGKILLCDYDNNQKYRIIFSDNSGKICNYTAEGKPTEGWKNPIAEVGNKINLMYRKLAGKDLFIISGSDNVAYLFNRKGERIAKIKDIWFNKSCRNFYVDEANKCFWSSNTDGSIIKVNTEGKTEIEFTGSYSNDYIFSYAEKSFYIFDEGNMYILNNNGKVGEKKNISKSSISEIKNISVKEKCFIGFINHNNNFGLIGCNNPFNINESNVEISNFDMVGCGNDILIIKGCNKIVSAETIKFEK